MELKLPKSFTVDRATWLRGNTNGATLLDEEGCRCCVGFLARDMGHSDTEMFCRSTLTDLSYENANLPSGLADADEETGAIYAVNDDDSLTDGQREATLTRLFADIGVEVRFVGDRHPTSE